MVRVWHHERVPLLLGRLLPAGRLRRFQPTRRNSLGVIPYFVRNSRAFAKNASASARLPISPAPRAFLSSFQIRTAMACLSA